MDKKQPPLPIEELTRLVEDLWGHFATDQKALASEQRAELARRLDAYAAARGCERRPR